MTLFFNIALKMIYQKIKMLNIVMLSYVKRHILWIFFSYLYIYIFIYENKQIV